MPTVRRRHKAKPLPGVIERAPPAGRFGALADALASLAWATDIDGRVAEDLHGWTGFTGRRVEPPAGPPWTDVVHPEDRAATAKAWQRIMRSRKADTLECRLRRADGTYPEFSLRLAPVHGRDGEIAEWLFVATDKSASAQALSALAQSEERLRTIVTSAPIVLFAVDREGLFTLSEGKGLDSLGLKPGEAVGKSVFELYKGTPEVGANIRRALAGEAFTGLVEIQNLFFETRYLPVPGPGGEIEGVIGVSTDVTERVRSQKSLRNINVALEERVRQRTLELKAANDELEAFTYSVSHDLRAPLRAVDNFSRMLSEDYAERLDDPGRDLLARLRRSATRMGQLIDDLLGLSRVTRHELQWERVNLSTLATAVVRDLGQRDVNRKVDWVIQDGVNGQGDARLLRVVLENLLGNAWKFTGKHKQARIEFGVQRFGTGPIYFVKDDGAGFEASQASVLFAPFQRLHRVEDFEGTGIGLVTVDRIVRRHGGRIWADGAIEQGATFYFTLASESRSG